MKTAIAYIFVIIIWYILTLIWKLLFAFVTNPLLFRILGNKPDSEHLFKVSHIFEFVDCFLLQIPAVLVGKGIFLLFGLHATYWLILLFAFLCISAAKQKPFSLLDPVAVTSMIFGCVSGLGVAWYLIL